MHLHSLFMLQYINLTPSLMGNALNGFSDEKNKGDSLLSWGLGFKPVVRSQVKISLVLSTFLMFVHLTQQLTHSGTGVTSSPCSKAGCPGLEMRILSARDSGFLT